ncbi:hypothetical protein MAR_006270 [Mya arenaria]|uniref:Uncharacterized protein n=1 Tax=Mya arenaria TaxID=6604 RepID=A0ABY7DBP7_MYAAR|nr:hypothetical protein MAR_006270 [Mya arenaria]
MAIGQFGARGVDVTSHAEMGQEDVVDPAITLRLLMVGSIAMGLRQKRAFVESTHVQSVGYPGPSGASVPVAVAME